MNILIIIAAVLISFAIGVPVGMEILGKPFTEGTLLEIAYGFEQHSHFRKVPKLGNKN